MKWSDGHPFTADDILYWWEVSSYEMEIEGAQAPYCMRIRDQHGFVEKLDTYKVRFVFPVPNGLFLSRLTAYDARVITNNPKHYSRKYHHYLGDMELVDKIMRARNLSSRREVTAEMADTYNPEMPRLDPWIYRTYTLNPPQEFVRNPYYFEVDTAGNQLPYVDRVLFDIKTAGMLSPHFSPARLCAGTRREV
jgi:ABC-type transport system substrate-binding protein